MVICPEASNKREYLSAKIQSKCEKGALEKVSNRCSPGFYSLLFVILKKNGKLSLVVDFGP